MKASDNLTNALKNIELMGDTIALLKSNYESMIEQALKDVKLEDRDKFQSFVNDSNDLLNRSTKVDLLKVQELTTDLKNKYGIGVNH